MVGDLSVTHPIDTLDWDTLREGFRNAHISSGVRNMKKEEFCSVRQGGRPLKEYMDDFCALSRYAPEDIETDAKSKEKFLWTQGRAEDTVVCGLCPQLSIPA